MFIATLVVYQKYSVAREEIQSVVIDQQIDINIATTESFELLPSIGPEMSIRIVNHRQQNGPFRSVDDLTNVKGIGWITLEKIRPFLRCSESKQLRVASHPERGEAAP